MRPKGTKAELEARRRRAVALVHKGKGVREVARLVGVGPGSVSRWLEMYEEKGEEGLDPKPNSGTKPLLTPKQQEKLAEYLLKGPRTHGYDTELWTLARIADVIEDRFGVTYHPCSVWKVLHRMGWSNQKPERRAREQDEDAVARWRAVEWPRIKKGRARAAEVSF
jgi:transposase